MGAGSRLLLTVAALKKTGRGKPILRIEIAGKEFYLAYGDQLRIVTDGVGKILTYEELEKWSQ